MLAEDMTRLSNEITNLRNKRGSLIVHLQHSNQSRKESISNLCTHLNESRMAAAGRMRHERLARIHNLQREVRAVRDGVQADLAGVRRAWSGMSA